MQESNSPQKNPRYPQDPYEDAGQLPSHNPLFSYPSEFASAGSSGINFGDPQKPLERELPRIGMSDGSYHGFPTPHSRYDANRQYSHYGHQYPGIPFENGIPHQNGLNSLGGLPSPFPRRDNGLPGSHTPTPAFRNHPSKFRPDPNLPAEFGVISGDNNTFYQRPPSPTAPAQSDDELPDASVIKGKRRQISKAQSESKKVKREEKSRDTPKPGSRNKVKGAAIKAEPISKKGHAPGARGYSDEESTALLLLALEARPLGGNAWEAVWMDYKNTAEEKGWSIRDAKSIRAKYDALLKLALSKPTGEAERSAVLELALEVRDAITERAATLDINDPVFQEEEQAQNPEIIEIDHSDEEPTAPVPRRDPIGPVKGTKAPKNGTVLTKAYRVENPVAAAKSRAAGGRHPSATEALGAITSFFDPAVMKNRDDERVSQAFQLSQMATLQAEIRELRQRLDIMSDKYHDELRRADKAENELRTYQILHGSQHQRTTVHTNVSHYRLPSPFSPDPHAYRSDTHFVGTSSRNAASTPHHTYHDNNSHMVAESSSQAAQRHDVQTEPTALDTLAFAAAAAPVEGSTTISRSLTLSLTPRRTQDGCLEVDISPSRQTS
ncbi:uncharacterized protein ARMOST_18799 [Armillaria ostoyae]|uniref:DUF6818 domain-containing protein n=1 Tax=Armillaria ostoyae TaxID=47428 RepID=A0A284S2U3_ARMOS|nr:uncharacterized protein ARMOST_18799 [Armillaria ostoyae]